MLDTCTLYDLYLLQFLENLIAIVSKFDLFSTNVCGKRNLPQFGLTLQTCVFNFCILYSRRRAIGV